MKLKSLLFATLFITAGASAQVTLQGAALNGWVPNDTIRDLTNTNAAAVPNSTWDLTVATYGTGIFGTTDQAGSHPSFPLANYRKDMSYGLNAVLGYQCILYWGKNNSGVYNYGEQVQRQAYSIAAVTMNPQDSLVFPEQTVIYSNPEKTIAFPMSFGGNWSSTVHYMTDFELTVTMYGLTNAPGERRSTSEIRDSVKGWGKMRVRDTNGQSSGYMDVLAVQEREYVTDSFYLNGSPAPAALLSSFGLAQGQVQSRFTTKFFRSGEVTPLLRLEHTDSTFTSSTGAIAMANRLASPITSVGGISKADVFDVYPNPVAGNVLHIEGLTKGNNWTYTLSSVNGQVLARGVLQAGNATVNTAGAASGVYSLSLFKDGRPQNAQFVIIP